MQTVPQGSRPDSSTFPHVHNRPVYSAIRSANGEAVDKNQANMLAIYFTHFPMCRHCTKCYLICQLKINHCYATTTNWFKTNRFIWLNVVRIQICLWNQTSHFGLLLLLKMKTMKASDRDQNIMVPVIKSFGSIKRNFSS